MSKLLLARILSSSAVPKRLFLVLVSLKNRPESFVNLKSISLHSRFLRPAESECRHTSLTCFFMETVYRSRFLLAKVVVQSIYLLSSDFIVISMSV